MFLFSLTFVTTGTVRSLKKGQSLSLSSAKVKDVIEIDSSSLRKITYHVTKELLPLNFAQVIFFDGSKNPA